MKNPSFFSLRTCLIFFSFFVISASAHGHSHDERKYTFGIVPQQAASKLAKTWNPVLKYLHKETGYKFQFTTAPKIPVFEKRLGKGRYDFSYMNPYHYVVYHKNPGYEAFAKAKGKQIHGIFVVRKDSLHQNLADLKSEKLAFPSPKAFAASILTRGELAKRDIDFKPIYVSSHDSVYRNVATGHFASGGGVVRTFKAASPEVRNQLRVLYKTPGYTPHAFASHPRVPADVVKKVRTALAKLETSEAGKKLLDSLKIKGIEPASDANWDDVRKLMIND